MYDHLERTSTAGSITALARSHAGGRALQSQDARRATTRIPRRGAAPDQDVGVEVGVSGPGDGTGPHGHLLEQRVLGAERLEDGPPQERADVALRTMSSRRPDSRCRATARTHDLGVTGSTDRTVGRAAHRSRRARTTKKPPIRMTPQSTAAASQRACVAVGSSATLHSA